MQSFVDGVDGTYSEFGVHSEYDAVVPGGSANDGNLSDGASSRLARSFLGQSTHEKACHTLDMSVWTKKGGRIEWGVGGGACVSTPLSCISLPVIAWQTPDVCVVLARLWH